MIAARIVGGATLAVASVMLWGHWQRQQELARDAPQDPRAADFAWRQARRRARGTALMAAIGGAIMLADRVPRNAWAISAYLFGLLGATIVLALFGLADWRASQAFHHCESVDLLRAHLAEHIKRHEHRSPDGDAEQQS
ncbi:MAG: hypothetical protein CMJ58_20950 [Planctomycetaceae bacterium]|nr:hypothetical protein [Planctomycetaceae bacterium]